MRSRGRRQSCQGAQCQSRGWGLGDIEVERSARERRYQAGLVVSRRGTGVRE